MADFHCDIEKKTGRSSELCPYQFIKLIVNVKNFEEN